MFKRVIFRSLLQKGSKAILDRIRAGFGCVFVAGGLPLGAVRFATCAGGAAHCPGNAKTPSISEAGSF